MSDAVSAKDAQRPAKFRKMNWMIPVDCGIRLDNREYAALSTWAQWPPSSVTWRRR
jgi:hypothetical protein